MRLIDANDYRKRRCRTCINRVQCDNGGNLCFDIMVLNTCPTIEAEPVVHGQWIRGENKGFPEKPSMIWYCSVCGERIRYNDTPRKYQKVKKKVNEVNPRCRRCGARMDGDSE